MDDSLRGQLIRAAREMNRRGINQGSAGNLSARVEGGMLITPSGLSYDAMADGDIVFVDGEGRAAGERRPSSEWRFHLDIYRERADAGAILHAHPAHCTALACMRQPIPAFHYMVAAAGGHDIRCAPYETFGTQALSRRVVEALRDRSACLMANHGLVCLGDDLDGALALADEVEHLARTYLLCLAAGGPAILDDGQMEQVLRKFEGYRRG
jgi:L-fuculose-phosphate aldolase